MITVPGQKIDPDVIRDMSREEILEEIDKQETILEKEQSVGTVAPGTSSQAMNENTSLERVTRRNIARLKTILNERKNGDMHGE